MGTITKALSLLNLFSVQQPEIGLTEFARLSRRDKATVHRHLVALEETGFLEQDVISRNYRLGPALLRLTAVRERTFPARDAVCPIINKLAEELGELVHATLLQGDLLSPLYHSDPQIRGTRVIYDESEMLPPHATASGIAMLTYGPTDFINRILGAPLERYTPKTITSKDDLLAAIKQTRINGYSYADQGFDSEVVAYAVPIFDHTDLAVGALSVPVPMSRMDAEKTEQILAALRTGCETASKSFGGRIPQSIREAWSENI